MICSPVSFIYLFTPTRARRPAALLGDDGNPSCGPVAARTGRNNGGDIGKTHSATTPSDNPRIIVTRCSSVDRGAVFPASQRQAGGRCRRLTRIMPGVLASGSPWFRRVEGLPFLPIPAFTNALPGALPGACPTTVRSRIRRYPSPIPITSSSRAERRCSRPAPSTTGASSTQVKRHRPQGLLSPLCFAAQCLRHRSYSSRRLAPLPPPTAAAFLVRYARRCALFPPHLITVRLLVSTCHALLSLSLARYRCTVLTLRT